jgi:hypothetical protein
VPDLRAFRPSGPLPDARGGAAALLRGLLDDLGGGMSVVESRSFLEWAQLVPETRGALDFDRFRFQIELYGDAAAHDREQVYMKAAQVGISTAAIRWVLFHADVLARTALYTFPTEKELGDFSRKRIRPVLRASEYLRDRMPADAIDNVMQKQIGAGWVQFRGTNKPIDAIDADVMVMDEYDSSDQANLEASERRVTGPFSAGLLRRVGVPSIPGFGIAKAYENSDQRVWTVRCDGCAKFNPMRGIDAFEHNIGREELVVVCRHCRRPLDVRAGEWVAAYPDRDVKGYHLPKLIVPGVDVRRLVANSQKTRPDQRQAFMNRDLGEAYSPAEGRVSLEQVRACVDPDARLEETLYSDQLVTMGIDVASSRAFNVVIEASVDDERGRKVFVGEVEDQPGGRTAFEELCRLMGAYGVRIACIDHAPEGRLAQAFAEAFPGRVFRVAYFEPKAGHQRSPDVWHIDDAEHYVALWRTRAIDATLERFRHQRIVLPPLETLPFNYPAQLGNLVRRTEEQANGNIRQGYVKTGPDDYAHAEVFNLCAIELFWRNVGRAAIRSTIAPLAELNPGEGMEEVAGELLPVYRPAFD